MANYKGTLLFTYQGSPPCGFSESFMFEAASDLVAKGVIANWPGQRIKWLASQWKIVGFRLASISNVTVSGKCKQVYTPVQIGACAGSPSGLLSDADTPFTAVLFKVMFADPAKRPRQYLARGIPDTWWTAGALTIPAADGNKFLTWFNFMKAQATGAFFYAPKKVPPCPTSLTPWSTYCTTRIASRRIGRPFGLIRGRKSKKKVV